MDNPNNNQEFKPIGTWTILIIYVIILIALWGNVYFTLLSRGVTR